MPREQRSNQIGVSFLITKEEHATYLEKAKELNMSLANFARFAMSHIDVKIIQK